MTCKQPFLGGYSTPDEDTNDPEGSHPEMQEQSHVLGGFNCKSEPNSEESKPKPEESPDPVSELELELEGESNRYPSAKEPKSDNRSWSQVVVCSCASMSD